MKRLFISSFLALLVIFAFHSLPLRGQGNFPRYCLESPDNLVKNCGFNEGLNNWQTFIEGGSANIGTIGGDDCHTINHPCGYISSNGVFVAGLYQQIPVAPGGIYQANVQLILYDSYDKADGGVGRKIGLDPTGGTDPASPNIVWSREVWEFDHQHRLIFEDLQVSATAQSDTMTLFVRINNLARVSSPLYQFWLDEIGMAQIGQAEPPAAATATNPPEPTATAPPTDTPEPTAAATATAAPPPTTAPTFTPSPEPTAAATATATPSPTATSTATATPTATPTVTPFPTATPTPPNSFIALLPALGGGIFCLSLGGILAVFILGGVIVWLYRLGQTADD